MKVIFHSWSLIFKNNKKEKAFLLFHLPGTASLHKYSILSIPYIPLQCETIPVGSSRWVRPPTRGIRVANTNMLVADTNMLVSKSLADPTRALMQANNAQRKPSMPNASRWNLVRVGNARIGFALGM